MPIELGVKWIKIIDYSTEKWALSRNISGCTMHMQLLVFFFKSYDLCNGMVK